MIFAELAPDEQSRLVDLKSFEILDTPADPDFDALVKLAADICQTPISLITLLDEERKWVKASSDLNISEPPRNLAFCSYALLQSEPLIVSDISLDPRFHDHPMVAGEPHFRFYAGVQLRTAQGHALGTLCVLDHQPRELTPFQLNSLQTLARQVMQLLERFRYTRLLKQQQERAEQILAGAELGIWEIAIGRSDSGWCSPQLYRLIGYADGEAGFSPREMQNRILPADLETVQQVMRAHLASSEPFSVEFRLRMKQGHYRWFESKGRSLWDSQTQTRKIVGTVNDIHELRQARLDLNSFHDAQVRLSQLSYAVDTPLTDILADGLKILRAYYDLPVASIVRIQGGVIEVLAMQESETCGQWLPAGAKTPLAGSLTSLIYDQDSVMTIQELSADANAQAKLVRMGIGTLIGAPFWVNGEAYGVVCAYGANAESLSEHANKFMQVFCHWLGQILERSYYIEHLKQLSMGKDRLLAVVAHDLRNPVGSALSAKRLIDLDHKSGKSAEPKMLELIEKACLQALQLIEELLEAAELEQAHLKLQLEPIRLGVFVQEVLLRFGPRATEKELFLSFAIEGEDPIVALNLRKMVRVLDNLLHNALKFTPAGGEIRLRLGRQDKQAWLEISDTGIGIPQKLQAVLFDKFSEARRQGLRGEQSNGLGMFIVNEIVQMHGGKIQVFSEVNQGTRFRISLPCVQLPVGREAIPPRPQLLA